MFNVYILTPNGITCWYMASLRHPGVGRWAGKGHVNRGQVVSAAAFSMSSSCEVTIDKTAAAYSVCMHCSSKASSLIHSLHPYMALKLNSESSHHDHTNTCHVYALKESSLEILELKKNLLDNMVKNCLMLVVWCKWCLVVLIYYFYKKILQDI